MRDSRVEVTILMGGTVPLHKSLHCSHKLNFSNKDNFSLQQRYKVWCVCSYKKILAYQANDQALLRKIRRLQILIFQGGITSFP